MSAYRIEVRPAAMRALRNLDPDIRPRIQGAIALLARTHDRRQPGHCEAAPAFDAGGRLPHHLHHEDAALVVVVVALGHRTGVYER